MSPRPIVRCVHCPPDMTKRATHLPCCSSHDRPLCCRHYRRAHFVEGQCCKQDVRPLVEEVANVTKG